MEGRGAYALSGVECEKPCQCIYLLVLLNFQLCPTHSMEHKVSLFPNCMQKLRCKSCSREFEELPVLFQLAKQPEVCGASEFLLRGLSEAIILGQEPYITVDQAGVEVTDCL